jgi:hypothetical protein
MRQWGDRLGLPAIARQHTSLAETVSPGRRNPYRLSGDSLRAWNAADDPLRDSARDLQAGAGDLAHPANRLLDRTAARRRGRRLPSRRRRRALRPRRGTLARAGLTLRRAARPGRPRRPGGRRVDRLRLLGRRAGGLGGPARAALLAAAPGARVRQLAENAAVRCRCWILSHARASLERAVSGYGCVETGRASNACGRATFEALADRLIGGVSAPDRLTSLFAALVCA